MLFSVYNWLNTRCQRQGLSAHGMV